MYLLVPISYTYISYVITKIILLSIKTNIDFTTQNKNFKIYNFRLKYLFNKLIVYLEIINIRFIIIKYVIIVS